MVHMVHHAPDTKDDRQEAKTSVTNYIMFIPFDLEEC